MKKFTISAQNLSDNCLRNTKLAIESIKDTVSNSLEINQSYKTFGGNTCLAFSVNGEFRFDLKVIENALKSFSITYDKQGSLFIIY